MSHDDRLRILVWHIRDVADEISDFVASYFEINHDVVWAAAFNEVPVLVRQLVDKLGEPPHTGT